MRRSSQTVLRMRIRISRKLVASRAEAKAGLRSCRPGRRRSQGREHPPKEAGMKPAGPRSRAEISAANKPWSNRAVR